jgi:preprotein translocase, YajC subunit
MFWTTTAYAMGQPGGGGDGAAGLMSFVPLVLMFGVFYFLLIRPQQKRQKEHKAMLGALKRGDRIVTAGGLYGRILEAEEEVLIVDLGGSTVTVGRAFVTGKVAQGPRQAGTPTAKKGKKGKDDEKAEAAGAFEADEAPEAPEQEAAEAAPAGEKKE